MPDENRSKQLGMSRLTSADPNTSRMPGPVIEEYGGEWSLAGWIKETGAELEAPAWYDYRPSCAGHVALGSTRERNTETHRQQEHANGDHLFQPVLSNGELSSSSRGAIRSCMKTTAQPQRRGKQSRQARVKHHSRVSNREVEGPAEASGRTRVERSSSVGPKAAVMAPRAHNISQRPGRQAAHASRPLK
jgi:hypothetical protein